MLDISQVTRTLVNVIQHHIENSSVWSDDSTLSVVPDPPDSLAGDNALGLYLYHIKEDPSMKNALPMGNSNPPIKFTAMPLILFYQLSAHSDLSSPTGSYREQMLLGAAMKALHDNPIINDDTLVAGETVMPLILRGQDNRIALELRPVEPEDAVNFWTAGSTPLRLAAYYQVSVILLEPEPMQRSANPVLDYNVFAFPDSTPLITSSRYSLDILPPGATESREIVLQPARAPYGARIVINGFNLSGDETFVYLQYADWDVPRRLNSIDWSIQSDNSEVSLVIQDNIDGDELAPGLYNLFIEVAKERVTPNGQTKQFTNLSNPTPIMIAPRIDTVSTPNANGVFTISGRIFEGVDITQDHVKLFLGESALTQGAAGSLAFAEFAIVDQENLEIRWLEDTSVGDVYYLRVQVRDADSLPRWLVIS